MRRLALSIGGALAALLILVVAGIAWLVDTSSGARFVLTSALGAAGYRVSLDSVEGRLLDHLRLKGVRLAKPKLSARIDTLELDWQPRRLLDWDLSVRQLTLAGVRIQDDQPPSGKPPRLKWPRVSGLPRRFSAEISRFKLSALSYRHLRQPPVLVSELSSSVSYRDGSLSLTGLSGGSPQGRISGEVIAGLARPSLRLDLALVPARPVQGMDLFSLQTRLLPGQGPEQVAGSIAAAGRSGGAQRLEFTGELGVTGTEFRLRRIGLSRPGRRGAVSGEGTLTLTKGEPLLALALTVADLDLSQELKQPVRLSGTLSFSGNSSGYRGRFALRNSGPGWRTAALAADYRGGEAGIRLAPLTAEVLEGKVTGTLEAAWRQGFRLRGKLAGRGLNPSRLAAQWSGLINLDLAATVDYDKQRGVRGEVNGKLLESRLHGQLLQGELVAAFAGERVRVDRLLLKGKGFDLHGAGALERRLDLVARVDDLSRLVPGAAGQLQADAWVRWRDRRLAGAASGQGSNLAFAGARVAAGRFNAALGEGRDYPVHLDASLNRLRLGSLQVETALLRLDGTPPRHTLEARLASPGGEALASLTGGYGKGAWRGELTRLSGRDRVGPWALTAPASLVLSRDRVYLSPLVLRGTPAERVELAADLTLQPASGWFRGGWSGIDLARANSWLTGVAVVGQSSGDLSLRLLPAKRIILSGRAEARATLTSNGRSVTVERATASVDGGGRGLHAALDLWLAQNSGQAHLLFDSRAPATLALPREGDLSARMMDLDLALLRPYLRDNLTLEGRLAGLVTGKLLPGGRIDARGNVALAQGRVVWRSEPKAESFDGAIRQAELNFGWHDAKKGAGRLKLSLAAAASGVFTARGERIALERAALRLDVDESGLRAGLDVSVQGGGTLRGRLSTAAPVGLAILKTGELALEWGGIDAMLLKPWFPGALNLRGTFSGQAAGKLLPGQRLDLNGEATFTQGQASWQGTGGQMNANIRTASLGFTWRGETLDGVLSLELAQYGTAKGRLLLPIPARLPVEPNPDGALQGFLMGQLREQGLLTAVFPGLVQESHGELNIDVTVAGIWKEPRVEGVLTLANAGAYLPSAGIRVSNVQLAARLERDQIRVDTLKAVSGAGQIEGRMLVKLQGWQVVGYSGTLSGERFQTVYLPELQMLTSPRLSFEGDAERVAIQGDLGIPEMLISGPPARTVVTPSKDVILEGAPPSEHKAFPVRVDGRIHVALGDKVQVKAAGIDAQLGGGMDLVLKGLESITSRGEIRVVKGRYRAYGIDLEIVRGRVYYEGGPVDQPTLDILALRTVSDVKAGVTVAGVLGEQVVKLYSEPTMPEVDILAYMVLGHPLGSSSEQGSLVATAASSLFSLGKSDSLQEQIKDRLGLNVLGLQTVDQSKAGLMGYKEIAVTPSGKAPAKASTGESLLTVGKYLTPKLYLSYGRSLVTGGSLFQLRYDIFRHWQIETQSGSESGADLYYKLEFD